MKKYKTIKKVVKPLDEVKLIKQTCLICEKKFEGTVKIDICPNCFV